MGSEPSGVHLDLTPMPSVPEILTCIQNMFLQLFFRNLDLSWSLVEPQYCSPQAAHVMRYTTWWKWWKCALWKWWKCALSEKRQQAKFHRADTLDVGNIKIPKSPYMSSPNSIKVMHFWMFKGTSGKKVQLTVFLTQEVVHPTILSWVRL